MRKLNILIAGSTGYMGVQLVKLLIKHKNINIKYLCGNSSVGKNISYYDKKLRNKKLPRIIKFNKSYLKDVDIVFCFMINFIPFFILFWIIKSKISSKVYESIFW